jgi:Ni,Fe-hydrogenase III large subunit
MSTFTMLLPFGPQHPMLHEPAHFKFEVDGETVVNVTPYLNYVHRGIEKLLENRTYVQGLYVAARVCGICNPSHTNAFVAAVEEAMGIEPPPRAKYLRVVTQEIHRIQSHLILFAVAAEEMGFNSLFMLIWRDRERILRLIEAITGGRVMQSYDRIGGVYRDINDILAERVIKELSEMRNRVIQYRKVFSEDPIVRRRTVDVGVLKTAEMVRLGGVGPFARASAVDYDVRRDHRSNHVAYDEVPFNVITREECDVWARLIARVDETLECINMIEYALKHMPSGAIRYRAPRAAPKGAEGIGRVEAPRGELVHHTISDGQRPYRHRIRTPSFANVFPAAKAHIGYSIADIPMIYVSWDPCFSCLARVTLVDIRSGTAKVISGEELRREARRRWEK